MCSGSEITCLTLMSPPVGAVHRHLCHWMKSTVSPGDLSCSVPTLDDSRAASHLSSGCINRGGCHQEVGTSLKRQTSSPFHDSTTNFAIFQAGRGRGTFIQCCVRKLWLTCTEYKITQGVSHTSEEALTGMAYMLGC